MNTRESHRKLADDIVAALKDVATKHGVTITPYGGQLGDLHAIVRLSVTKVQTTADGSEVSLSQEQSRFLANAEQLGFKKTDLGRTFVDGTASYTLHGVTRTLKVIGERNGKLYRCRCSLFAIRLQWEAEAKGPAALIKEFCGVEVKR